MPDTPISTSAAAPSRHDDPHADLRKALSRSIQVVGRRHQSPQLKPVPAHLCRALAAEGYAIEKLRHDGIGARKEEIAGARHAFIAFLRNCPFYDLSLSEIGLMVNRHHGTVMASLDVASRMIGNTHTPKANACNAVNAALWCAEIEHRTAILGPELRVLEGGRS